MFKKPPIRPSANFSAKALRPEGNDMIYSKWWNKKYLQTMIFYLVRLFFRFERELKSCTDKQKLKEFSIGFTRNVKGTSLNRKEKTQLEIWKLQKEKSDW